MEDLKKSGFNERLWEVLSQVKETPKALAVIAAVSGTIGSVDESLAGGLRSKVYGRALPPIGYVGFCKKHKDDPNCLDQNQKVRTLILTKENWKILHEVNRYANKIEPKTDESNYGEPEYWTYPNSGADCEDYVLQKKRYLKGLGLPAGPMLITVVLDKEGGGHAVLLVKTDRGDFILDNMTNKIVRWDKNGYTYIKRQSLNPTQWVAMIKRRKKQRNPKNLGN